jgi:predicted DNA-binding transcriptional regulator AlpA
MLYFRQFWTVGVKNMDEKARKFAKNLGMDLNSESIKEDTDKYLSFIESRQDRIEAIDKQIASLEKELVKARGLKEQIEIIQIKKYISMKELQLYINRSRAWINNQILTNDFPSGTKKSGKEHLFLRIAVDKWVDDKLL